jgi:hypothetical protein
VSISTAVCPAWSTATTTPVNAVLVGGRAVFPRRQAADRSDRAGRAQGACDHGARE